MRGQGDDGNVLRRPASFFGLALVGADAHRRLIAVQLGHLAIHQDQVVVADTVHGDRLQAVAGNVCPAAEFSKHMDDHRLIDHVVVHHQDAIAVERQFGARPLQRRRMIGAADETGRLAALQRPAQDVQRMHQGVARQRFLEQGGKTRLGQQMGVSRRRLGAQHDQQGVAQFHVALDGAAQANAVDILQARRDHGNAVGIVRLHCSLQRGQCFGAAAAAVDTHAFVQQ